MDLCWRVIVKALVWPFVVIEAEIVSQPGLQCRNSSVVFKVNVLVLDTVPGPFNEDVVQGTATPIHADLDCGACQATREGIGGELDTL